MNDIFNIISEILDYILNLKLFDIPLHLLYAMMIIAMGHCIGMIIVGFPISIYEELAKKEIKNETKEKIEWCVSVFFIIILSIAFLYSFAT